MINFTSENDEFSSVFDEYSSGLHFCTFFTQKKNDGNIHQEMVPDFVAK